MTAKRPPNRSTIRQQAHGTARANRAPKRLPTMQTASAAVLGNGSKATRREPSRIKELERELAGTKGELQPTIEPLEAVKEELRVPVEETMSMRNQERQSAKEALQPSKEQLQATNQEMSAVNAQLAQKVRELTEARDDLANLVRSTDLAAVFLDERLRIKRFTLAATKLLRVGASDLGRPITDLQMTISGLDLSQECGAVFQTLEPREREVEEQGGKEYLVRILPCRTAAHVVQGVVVTFTDVSMMRAIQDQIARHKRQQEALAVLGRLALAGQALNTLLFETLRHATDVLGLQYGEVLEWLAKTERVALRAWSGWTPPESDVSVELAAAVGPAAALRDDHPIVVEDRRADRRVSTPDPFGDRQIVSSVSAAIRIAERTWGILCLHGVGRRIFEEDEVQFVQGLAGLLANAVARSQYEGELEARVKERVLWILLLHEVTRAANEAETTEDAFKRALRSICDHQCWNYGTVFIREPVSGSLLSSGIWYGRDPSEVERWRQAGLGVRVARGHHMLGRVFASGRAEWTSKLARVEEPLRAIAGQLGIKTVAAFPVFVHDEAVAVLKFFSDRVMQPDDQVTQLMADVGVQLGRVMERHFFGEGFARALLREQRRLSHEVHDTLGQEVTGLTFLATAAARKLTAEASEHAGMVEEIAQRTQLLQRHVRSLSRGLAPVEDEPEGLMISLRELAETTRDLYGLACRFEHTEPIMVSNSLYALHLYRIAQEATTNAVKHSRAKQVVIRLHRADGGLRLTVEDDGIGLAKAVPTSGLGLRIMSYRSRMMGGELEMRPGEPGGTIISCLVPKLPN